MFVPIGRTNLETRESILFSFSKQSMVIGNVAEDDEVQKAVAKARLILLKNLKGKVLVKRPYSKGKSMHP